MLISHAYNKQPAFNDPSFWEKEGLYGFAEIVREHNADPVLRAAIIEGGKHFKRIKAKRLRDRAVALLFSAAFILFVLRCLYLVL